MTAWTLFRKMTGWKPIPRHTLHVRSEHSLAAFDPVWDSLSLLEQARVLHLLFERVDYDARTDDIAITIHPTGIKTLAAELADKQENAA